MRILGKGPSPEPHMPQAWEDACGSSFRDTVETPPQEIFQVGGTVVGIESIGDEDLGMVWRACKVDERVGKGLACGILLERVSEEDETACMDA